MKVTIVDYGSGNLRSAQKAFERMAREADLTADILVTPDPEEVLSADRVVLPGVGAFGDCRQGLGKLTGMIEALEETVIKKGRPFLGICVGMQLMASAGHEHGTHPGLGWIKGDVVPIEPADENLKVPHMGWNELHIYGAHPVLEDLGATHAYFVHSYHLKAANPGEVLAEVDYGGRLTAVVARDNMIGTQFHPEKSQMLGLSLIRNFLHWKP